MVRSQAPARVRASVSKLGTEAPRSGHRAQTFCHTKVTAPEVTPKAVERKCQGSRAFHRPGKDWKSRSEQKRGSYLT